jgi:hypothetical protein
MSIMSVLALVLGYGAFRPREIELECEIAGLRIDLADMRRDLDQIREDYDALRRENSVQVPSPEMMGLVEARARAERTIAEELNRQAARLVMERRLNSQQAQAAMQQQMQKLCGQGFAAVNPYEGQLMGINPQDMWCNCVPSRAQVWATNGPVLGE